MLKGGIFMNIKRYRKNIIVNEKKEKNTTERISQDGGVHMNANTLQRPCTILQSIEESFNEVKLIRDGKLPKKTWKELREEKRKKREK
jgi:hypothetical protein